MKKILKLLLLLPLSLSVVGCGKEENQSDSVEKEFPEEQVYGTALMNRINVENGTYSNYEYQTFLNQISTNGKSYLLDLSNDSNVVTYDKYYIHKLESDTNYTYIEKFYFLDTNLGYYLGTPMDPDPNYSIDIEAYFYSQDSLDDLTYEVFTSSTDSNLKIVNLKSSQDNKTYGSIYFQTSDYVKYLSYDYCKNFVKDRLIKVNE